jgi:hypothetical protein
MALHDLTNGAGSLSRQRFLHIVRKAAGKLLWRAIALLCQPRSSKAPTMPLTDVCYKVG